ncbi:MAG: ABC transporter ATP-binding protein [Candidatus Scalinduaceae bacterium]
MNSNDIAIKVDNLGKCYRIGLKENMHDNFGSAFFDFLKSPIKNYRKYRSLYKFDEVVTDQESYFNNKVSSIIWALRDVSFEVKRGDVLGVIGGNGAGKSTLLKILSKVTDPTAGRVEFKGRISSLLEVGTGFHPELTGRENVYLNGAILGMRKREIDRKFDEIVDFSGVERFIDTPVKRYSTGMKVRLAFSVAAHMEPEILMVDEVLAVGDAAFQKKCLGKMSDVVKEGRTILFVSHNMTAMQQLTKNSILLQEGRLIYKGTTEDVINRYLEASMNYTTTVYHVEKTPRRYKKLSQQVEFLSLEIENSSTKLLPADAEIPILITVRGNESVNKFRFSMTIFRLNGTPVGNLFGFENNAIKKGEMATFRMRLNDLRLAHGRYYCALAVGKGNHIQGRIEFDIINDVLHFEVMPEKGVKGVITEWGQDWGAIRFKEPTVARIA